MNQLASCEKLDTFDFCYNTIPAPVLDRAVLSKLRPDVVILDIASKPGGTDFAYLDEQGICYKHSLGFRDGIHQKLPVRFWARQFCRIFDKTVT